MQKQTSLELRWQEAESCGGADGGAAGGAAGAGTASQRQLDMKV